MLSSVEVGLGVILLADVSIVESENRETFTIRWNERPFTTNAERRMHRHARGDLTRYWRNIFATLAREAKIPSLEEVSIIATPYYKDRRWLEDCGGCAPTVKAAIDGLVDANVMPDDNPQYLKFIGFNAPVIDYDFGLELEITGNVVHRLNNGRNRKPATIKRKRNGNRPTGL